MIMRQLPQYILYSTLASCVLLSSCDQETRDELKRQAVGMLEQQVKESFSEELQTLEEVQAHVREISANLNPQQMYEKAVSLLKPDISGAASYDATIIELIRQSAEAGYAKAQRDLAGLYLEGAEGIAANKQQALEWFQKAASQGDQAARYYVADLLYRGEGVVQDKAKALQEWRVAADAGLAEAQYRMSKFLHEGKVLTAEGRNYLESAASSGLAKAARDLGYAHARGEHGYGVDMNKAAYWYEKAASAGDAESLYISSLLLLQGDTVDTDTNKAVRYLKMAAGQDHMPSLELLISILRQQDSYLDQREVLAWEERLKQLKAQNTQQK